MGVETWAPMALSGLGMIAGKDQARGQELIAEEANANQKELIKRQTALFDQILGMVKGADASGQFDPSAQLLKLDQDIQKGQTSDMEALSGAMRVAGYKPGDSEIGAQLRGVQKNYADRRLTMAQAIRDNAFDRKLNAYRGVDTQSLNPGIQTYGQNAATANQNAAGIGAGMFNGFQGMLGALANKEHWVASTKSPLTPAQQQGIINHVNTVAPGFLMGGFGRRI